MYIDKTTAAERLIIAKSADTAFNYVSRARRLLMRVLSEYFEDAEQKPISKDDAEDLGDILLAVNDALWMAETDYFATVGECWLVPDGECHYEGAKRALLVREVERLRGKLNPEDKAPYDDMPDEEALPILREIAKKKGVKVDE